MDAQSFIKELSPLLRAADFKKSGVTWRCDQSESIAVLSVQKSRWGGGEYYILVGVYFRSLGEEAAPPVNHCHVQTKLRVDHPEAVFNAANAWFRARATLQDAVLLAESDSKQGLVFKELRLSRA